ncbi:MAG: sensor histidine kinase, partial [Magnetospiraceae bacterium]
QILPETQRIVFEKRVSVPVNAHFVGDSRALGQMLVNILSNAVKYSPADSTIYIAAELDDTGAMRLRFRDEGTGMTEAEIQRAAEPFERGQAGDAVKQKGTGLGLYLCAKVMMLFGGTLKIDSAEGKGTTVTLTFPPSRTILPKTVATFPPPDLPEQPTPRP